MSRRITILICDRMNRTRSIRQEEVKQLVPVKELGIWLLDCCKLFLNFVIYSIFYHILVLAGVGWNQANSEDLS